MVPAEQTEKLFQSYLGQKQIHYTGEDHNSTRENSLIERILLWLKKRSPIFEPRSQQVQTATPHALGVGARIKNKIMQSQIPIKQIDLNCFCERVKERSATFDGKVKAMRRQPVQEQQLGVAAAADEGDDAGAEIQPDAADAAVALRRPLDIGEQDKPVD